MKFFFSKMLWRINLSDCMMVDFIVHKIEMKENFYFFLFFSWWLYGDCSVHVLYVKELGKCNM